MPDAISAVNPNISLNVAGGGGPNAPQSPGTGLGLGQMAGFAQLQQVLNANRLFQQQFSAKQQAGQIIAASPDIETGISNLLKNPSVASFAPDIVSELRNMQQTMTTTRGLQATQNRDAFGAVLKGATGALDNPSQLLPMMMTQLKLMPEEIQQRVLPAVQSFAQAMTSGLPADPVAGKQEYNKRLNASLLGSGVANDAMMQSLGILPKQVVQGPYGPGGAPSATVVGGPPWAGGNSLAPGGASSTSTGGSTSGPGPLVGLTPEQEEYQRSSGKAAGDLQSEMATRSEALPAALRRIDMMTDALKDFQSGGWADARAAIAKNLQGARNAGATFISPDLINAVGNNSLPATQLFNAQVKPLVIGELKSAAQGTGRVMRSEVDAFINMMDATTDPMTLMNLLNQAKYSLQVGNAQAQKFPQFKQLLAKKDPSVAGMNLPDYFSWFNANTKPGDLPSVLGTGSLAPSSVGAAQGGLGQTPTTRWNAVTGKLEPVRSGGGP